MSKNENIYDNFEQAIRTSIGDSEQQPSQQLWDRIASTMDSAAKPAIAPLTLALRWCGAIAASILVAFAANSFIASNNRETIETYDSIIAEFKELPSTPIYIEPTTIAPAAPRVIAHNSATSPKEERVHAIAESIEPATPAEQSPSTKVDNNAATRKTESANKATGYQYNNAHYAADNTKPKQPISLSMKVSGGSAASSNLVSSASAMLTSDIPNEKSAMLAIQQGPSNRPKPEPLNYIKHHAPISAAISAAYRLDRRWSVESGVSYTCLISDGITAFSDNNIRQRLDFVGVPLRINYHLVSTPRISLYTGLGGQIERCLSAKINNVSVNENPWHTSAEAVLGLQYNINSWLGVYAEPEMTYYFTPTKLLSARNQTPLSFNMSFGLRFTFGK